MLRLVQDLYKVSGVFGAPKKEFILTNANIRMLRKAKVEYERTINKGHYLHVK